MNQHYEIPTLKAGCKAYFETWTAGLIPCKVLSVKSDSHGFAAWIQFTVKYCDFPKSRVWHVDSHSVIPRHCVIVRKGCSTRIMGYEVQADNA